MKHALLILLVACGPRAAQPTQPPPKPPLPLDQDLPRLTNRTLALYTELAHAFGASTDTCPTVTARLVALRPRYADVVDAHAKLVAAGKSAEVRAALLVRETEFTPLAKAVVDAPRLVACGDDPAFVTALDALLGNR